MHHLRPGSFLQDEKYRIIKVLGQGGFGITYLAEQTWLERNVCIKEFFLKDFCSRDGETSSVSLGTEGNKELMQKYQDKFLKEARLIAKFKHPNIIHIHEGFKENNTAYYVTDYIDGGSLNDLVKKNGALDEGTALSYIRQIGAGLSYVHSKGINHLDVKPGNVMLSKEDNSVVLIDFGMSKQYDEAGDQTSTTPMGTSAGYAPLEQYNAGGVSSFSPQTDVYSLAATLYRLVTGLVPPVASEVMNEGIPEMPETISEATRSAIEKGMAFRKKDRPATVEEFLAMLPADIAAKPAEKTKPAEKAQKARKAAPMPADEDAATVLIEETVIPKPKAEARPKPEKKAQEPKKEPVKKEYVPAYLKYLNEHKRLPIFLKKKEADELIPILEEAIAADDKYAVVLLSRIYDDFGREKEALQSVNTVLNCKDEFVSREAKLQKLSILAGREEASSRRTCNELVKDLQSIADKDFQENLRLREASQDISKLESLAKTALDQEIAACALLFLNIYYLFAGIEDGESYKSLLTIKGEAAPLGKALYSFQPVIKAIGEDKKINKEKAAKAAAALVDAIDYSKSLSDCGILSTFGHLAGMFYSSDDVPCKDVNKAFEYYSLSAEAGNEDSMSELALMLEKGIGCKKDLAKAAEWMTKAAEKDPDYKDESERLNAIQKGLPWVRIDDIEVSTPDNKNIFIDVSYRSENAKSITMRLDTYNGFSQNSKFITCRVERTNERSGETCFEIDFSNTNIQLKEDAIEKIQMVVTASVSDKELSTAKVNVRINHIGHIFSHDEWHIDEVGDVKRT